MAGLNGFEPLHAGVKVQCLTAWRQPNNYFLRQEPLYKKISILSTLYFIILKIIFKLYKELFNKVIFDLLYLV